MTKHTHDPLAVYSRTGIHDPAEATKTGPRRANIEKREQSRAVRAVTALWPSVVYAVRFPDGTFKIGCSTNLAARHRKFRAKGGEIVGFMAGDFDDERAIHQSLHHAVMRGREWYHPEPEVLAVVNEMRDQFDLPHLAA